MTRLFCDCEWADKHARELVSIALVSSEGRHRFYAEVDPLPETPTDFVRDTVYPLLERGASAMSRANLALALREFLRCFDDPEVLYDCHVDGKFLHSALGWAPSADKPLRMRSALIVNDHVNSLYEEYFRTHSEVAARRHHAGVDAEALRWAFLVAIRRRKRGPRF